MIHKISQWIQGIFTGEMCFDLMTITLFITIVIAFILISYWIVRGILDLFNI